MTYQIIKPQIKLEISTSSLKEISKQFNYVINRQDKLNLDIIMNEKQVSFEQLESLIQFLIADIDTLANTVGQLSFKTIDKSDYPAKSISRKSLYFELIDSRLYGYINKRHLCLRWV